MGWWTHCTRYRGRGEISPSLTSSPNPSLLGPDVDLAVDAGANHPPSAAGGVTFSSLDHALTALV